jgi:hypothetical protein
MIIPIFLERIVTKVANVFEGKTVYEKYTLGGGELSDHQKSLVKLNRNLLLENQVPINKVRFVFGPTFTYDVDKDVINPKYEAMLPLNGTTGLFQKKAPVIEIGKPEKLITISVESYKVNDNYELIADMLNYGKRGVAIFIVDEMVANFIVDKGIPQRYHFGVDTEELRIVSLDAIVEYYIGCNLL